MRILLVAFVVLLVSVSANAATKESSRLAASTPSGSAALGRMNGGKPSAVYKRATAPKRAMESLVICPEEPCGGDDPYVIQEWSGFMTDRDVGQVDESVEIVGRRWSDGWSTVCTGSACADFIEGMYMSQPQRNWVVEWYIDFMDVREIEVDACKNVARQPTPENKQTVANTTSKSSAEDRYAAAAAIWGGSTTRQETYQKSGQFATSVAYGANGGFEVTVTFSDGGTERFKMIVGPSSELTRMEGTLKEGDGASRCPA